VDRPSYSYEHVLVFSSNPKHYWNRDAVLQEYAASSIDQLKTPYTGQSDVAFHQRTNSEVPSDLKRKMIESMHNREGAYLRSVWQISSGSQPKVMVRGEEVRGIASFPLLLAEIVVNLACPTDGLVVDPFCGMGTTIAAAIKWGRRAKGFELSPKFSEAATVRINQLEAELFSQYP
jgi:DNA modification methylase